VVHAAARLFSGRGYPATAVADIAREAGVAVDTVYALVGRKPQLLLAAHDLLLGEGATDAAGEPVAALQRRYVQAVRAADTAESKLATYAEALGRLLPRTAPLLEALRLAGETEADCQQLWQLVEERRAANMLLLASDLRATGELRAGLTDQHVADLIWSMNSPTYYLALDRRGRGGERYADFVREVWVRTLLR
jgi:AcrR family transcriptional regulator